MRTDIYSQNIYTEAELCDLVLTDPGVNLDGAFTDLEIVIPAELELETRPRIRKYADPGVTPAEFDRKNQSGWLMPPKYREIDLVEWLTARCTCESELQRVAEELLLYMERGMFPLLQYLIYLVDTMRENQIIWGVGRGSSVCSFVLYVIGVHRINSIYWDLDIREFLK